MIASLIPACSIPHSFRGLILCSALSVVAAAGENRPLRELSTDRPDTTESPRTVDVGHIQLEWEIASLSRESSRWSDWSALEMNAKYGLSDSTDIQFVVPFFNSVRGAGEGIGDVEIRLKHNLWGNDGGSSALALMPYVKLPTAHQDMGNDKIEGGLIIPLGLDGPGAWGFGLMAELDAVRDPDSNWELEILVSATAGHPLSDTAAFFVEIEAVFDFIGGTDSALSFNSGLTLALRENWQLDGGVRTGISGDVLDLTPFLGLSMKF